MASISKQPKEMQERHKRVLNGMLKLAENRECADCRARNPTWASTNLGVFVCIRCSGLHRQVGVHITKVKSCTMDLWAPEQIAHIQKLGNGVGKRIYEAKLPANYGKPAESEDSALVLQWIRAKYEKKKFIHDNPQGVIDAATSAASGSAGAAATGAVGGADAPRALPGRARRDRQQQQPQQPAAQPPQQQQAAQGGFVSNNDGFSSGGGFGFDSSAQAAPSQGFGTDANGGGFGGGFGFADASSPDGTASPAFGTMPGTAFGFVASPVVPSSPREGFGGAAPPQPRGEDALDFSYTNGGGGAHKPQAAAAFDPFADVDAAQQQPPLKYAAASSTGSAPGAASPTVPMSLGSTIGTVFQAPAAADATQNGGGDFEAQMRSMQQQLATQQAYLDSLQLQSGIASA